MRVAELVPALVMVGGGWFSAPQRDLQLGHGCQMSSTLHDGTWLSMKQDFSISHPTCRPPDQMKSICCDHEKMHTFKRCIPGVPLFMETVGVYVQIIKINFSQLPKHPFNFRWKSQGRKLPLNKTDKLDQFTIYQPHQNRISDNRDPTAGKLILLSSCHFICCVKLKIRGSFFKNSKPFKLHWCPPQGPHAPQQRVITYKILSQTELEPNNAERHCNLHAKIGALGHAEIQAL